MKESKLVLGTVQFGLNYGIANTDGKPAPERVRQILQTAYDNGIRTLDTAAAYGESETVLGTELKNLGLLDKMKIVSKVPPVPANFSDCEVEKFIIKSLEFDNPPETDEELMDRLMTYKNGYYLSKKSAYIKMALQLNIKNVIKRERTDIIKQAMADACIVTISDNK